MHAAPTRCAEHLGTLLTLLGELEWRDGHPGSAVKAYEDATELLEAAFPAGDHPLVKAARDGLANLREGDRRPPQDDPPYAA